MNPFNHVLFIGTLNVLAFSIFTVITDTTIGEWTMAVASISSMVLGLGLWLKPLNMKNRTFEFRFPDRVQLISPETAKGWETVDSKVVSDHLSVEKVGSDIVILKEGKELITLPFHVILQTVFITDPKKAG